MPLLSVQNLTKTFGKIRAVDQLSITVERGELFGLVGPSGCGKTTTLRLILGLEAPDRGGIEFAGSDITSVPPEVRRFGMVFQNYALFTNLNIFENIAFGLRAHGGTEASIRKQVDDLLALVRLPGDCASRRVEQLSAGQQQRVAIARALAAKPPLLLLDEPLAHLDAGLRRHTGDEIRAIIKRLNVAAVYVTHDQSEAFMLCDRIAVMSNGGLLQTGIPSEVYEHPSQLPVAQFLGFNILRARRVGPLEDGLGWFEIVDGGWRLQARLGSDRVGPETDDCAIAIRPEDIHVREKDGAGHRAKVRRVLFAGSISRLILDVGGVALETFVAGAFRMSPGDDCVIEIPPGRILAFPSRLGDLTQPT